jgi:hypothetical protein
LCCGHYFFIFEIKKIPAPTIPSVTQIFIPAFSVPGGGGGGNFLSSTLLAATNCAASLPKPPRLNLSATSSIVIVLLNQVERPKIFLVPFAWIYLTMFNASFCTLSPSLIPS